MTSSLIAAFAAPLALQSAAPATTAKPTDFADLPIEEATAPRCGVALATAQGWQETGDPRGSDWPDIASSDAREFFVRAMVRLIDAYSLERAELQRLIEGETLRQRADGGATTEAMLPACLALLEASPPRAR